MPVRSFFNAAPAALGEVIAAALPEGVRVGFDIAPVDGTTDGGAWTVDTENGVVTVRDGIVEPLDCLLRGVGNEFLELLSGSEDARALFLSGRLAVEGDVGLVLQLQRAIRGTWDGT